MNHIWIALGVAAGAFAHCLGMCGGFALHLSGGRTRRETLARQFLWHGGRTFSYIFLGAMAGLFGGWLGRAAVIPRIQDYLAYAAGGLMILMGASLLGLFPWRGRGAKRAEASGRDRSAAQHHLSSGAVCADGGDGLLTVIFRQFLSQPTASGALALGLATGFLPCPIVWAFLAFSMQSGSPLTGMTVMAALGVGTAWSLLLLGFSGHSLIRRLRAPPNTRHSKVAAAMRKCGIMAPGIILVLLGLATVLRGTQAFHRILGCPPAPAQVQQKASESCACCADLR